VTPDPAPAEDDLPLGPPWDRDGIAAARGEGVGDDPGDAQGSRDAMRRRAQAARARGEDLVADLERRRPESAVVESGFRWLARDRRIAGGILSGGLAYRFFFWMLALSVLTSGGLGLFSRFGADVEEAAAGGGFSDAVAGTAADVAEQSAATSVWLFLVGVWLVVWFGWGVLRALWLVHAAAWAVEPPPLRRIPQGVAGVVALPFALVALAGLATWVRAHLGFLPGILATLAVGVALGVFWLWVQTKLPSEPAPWTAHLPGAVTIALGFEAMHVFTVYFLSDKLQNASSLYGVLGLAATMLFFLFMLGRIIVWSAELNAVTWAVWRERRSDPKLTAS
jgi:uncharacterized BrkB/YihY/UPF0761 family membrane protein